MRLTPLVLHQIIIIVYPPPAAGNSPARILEPADASSAPGWPDRRSRHPSAMGRKSRLLRRQMLRTFEHMLDLNRPSRALVRPPTLNVRRPFPPSSGEAEQAGLWGRLRSAPGRNSLAIAAEGGDSSSRCRRMLRSPIRPASRAHSARPLTYSSNGTSGGTNTATDHSLRFLIPLQTNNIPKNALKISEVKQFDSLAFCHPTPRC
jgi:hypothetical protein